MNLKVSQVSINRIVNFSASSLTFLAKTFIQILEPLKYNTEFLKYSYKFHKHILDFSCKLPDKLFCKDLILTKEWDMYKFFVVDPICLLSLDLDNKFFFSYKLEVLRKMFL